MDESFDPYYKWLGIPPHEQPPNHYRLLGIPAFTADTDVIDNAADRQMAHLQRHANGPHAALSQKLLNEVSAARVCLLDPAKKEKYDEQLRAKLQQAAVVAQGAGAPAVEGSLSPGAPAQPKQLRTRPAQPVPIAQPAPVEPPLGGITVKAQRGPSRSPQPQPLLIGAAALGVIVVGVALAFVLTRSSSEPAADANLAQATMPEQEKTPPNTPRPSPIEAQTIPELKKPQPQSGLKAEPPVASRPKSGPTPPTDPVAAPQPPPDANAVNVTNVASEAVPTAPVACKLLRGKSAPQGLMPGAIPFTAPRGDGRHGANGFLIAAPQDWQTQGTEWSFDYRRSGSAWNVQVIHPYKQGHVYVTIGTTATSVSTPRTWPTWRDPARAISYSSQSAIPAGFAIDGEPFHSLRSVLSPSGKFQLYIDGKLAVATSVGQPEAPLVLGEGFAGAGLPGPIDEGTAGIIVGPLDNGLMEAKEIRLSAAKTQPLAIDANSPAIDLIAQIDPQRDLGNARWTLTDGALVSDQSAHNRFQLPGRPPSRYRLELVCNRQRGEHLLAIGLVCGGRQVVLFIDAPENGQWMSGLSYVQGRPFYNSPSNDAGGESITREPALKNGERHRVVCDVAPGRIRAMCDDTLLVDWQGNSGDLSIHPAWHVADPQSLFLGSYGCAYRVESLRLTPLLGELPAEAPLAGEPVKSVGTGRVVKLAVPDEATQDRMLAKLKEIFAEDYAQAIRPEGKANLARVLIGQVAETPNDAAARYVMLSEACQMAAAAGEPELMSKALTALEDSYELGGWELPLSIFSQLKSSAKTAEARESFFEAATAWSQRAIQADAYDAALTLASDAASAVLRARDAEVRKRAVAHREAVRAMQKGWESVRESFDTLQQKPDDPAANTAVGKFLCFVKRDWDRGISHLAKGDDAALRQLAVRELKQPADVKYRVALADAWWGHGETLSDADKNAAQQRAAHWYAAADPDLQGLEKARVVKRMKDMGAIVDLMALIKPGKVSYRGNWQFDKGVLLSPSDPVALLQFPYVPPEEYDVILTAQRVQTKGTINYGQDALAFGLSHSGAQFLLVMDWYVHGRSHDLALYAADGKGPGDENPLHRYAHYFGEKPVTVVVRVRKERVQVEVDGATAADWQVDYDKLSLPDEWTPGDRQQLFIGSRLCNFRITQLEVLQVTP